MGISLQKGSKVSLTKKSSGLNKIHVGLGWDEAVEDAGADLDVSVFLLNSQGKVARDEDFIFYNNLVGAQGAVEHMGDNRIGGGSGDDEVIKIDLNGLHAYDPSLVMAAFVCSIHGGTFTFGQVQNAFIRIINDETKDEIVRFDLTDRYSSETALLFGVLSKAGMDWNFSAIGQGGAGGLEAACRKYGVNV